MNIIHTFVHITNLRIMFSKEVYQNRRLVLMERMAAALPEGQRGIALFIGNAEAPAQYKDNCYKWRQDSSWLYYFGIDSPKYAAVIDFDSSETVIYADDFDMDDIIWMGPQQSVASKAASVGIGRTAPYKALEPAVSAALSAGRRVHFLPPSRYYNTIMLAELTGCRRSEVSVVAAGAGNHASEELVKAVISQRIIKEACEIEQIDDACDLGFEMHSAGRDSIVPGIVEQEIVGRMEGITYSKGWGPSFPVILTQHGETLHNHMHDKVIEPGKLMVIDAGAENNMHYASDFTRTYPTSGSFSTKQKEIYQIVCDCNNLAFGLTRPGITYREIHLATARKMLEGLHGLGLVNGDIDSMVADGIAGLFQPHGLGHNMGLDVHDMEDLGENLVGYDEGQTRASQVGLGNLRMARRLRPGHVITDEPGIYFIPAFIEQWKREGRGRGVINFGKLESYYDFGGIRLEDDVLVTESGARRLGRRRLPIEIADVEEAMRHE